MERHKLLQIVNQFNIYILAPNIEVLWCLRHKGEEKSGIVRQSGDQNFLMNETIMMIFYKSLIFWDPLRGMSAYDQQITLYSNWPLAIWCHFVAVVAVVTWANIADYNLSLILKLEAQLSLVLPIVDCKRHHLVRPK